MTRIFRVLFIILVAVFALQSSEECRLSDIKTIIGGSDYTVDEMRGLYFEHAQRYMLMGFGRLTVTTDGISKAFLFLYDYTLCESLEVRQFEGANQGFKEAFAIDGYIYLLGYHEEQGKTSEVVVRQKMKRNRVDGRSVGFSDSEPWKDYAQLYSDFQGVALNRGFFSGGVNYAVVVDQDHLREYYFHKNAA